DNGRGAGRTQAEDSALRPRQAAGDRPSSRRNAAGPQASAISPAAYAPQLRLSRDAEVAGEVATSDAVYAPGRRIPFSAWAGWAGKGAHWADGFKGRKTAE